MLAVENENSPLYSDSLLPNEVRKSLIVTGHSHCRGDSSPKAEVGLPSPSPLGIHCEAGKSRPRAWAVRALGPDADAATDSQGAVEPDPGWLPLQRTIRNSL